jgi:serine/threonine-protein kinase TTK/MPS1
MVGCILYQIHYGRPPFAALTTIQKLHAIPSDKYVIQYPENDGYSIDKDAIATMKACLERDPRKRATIRGDKGTYI